MTRTIAVTCPEAVRTKNRRSKKGRIYGSSSWKRDKAAFVAGKKCEWCGSTEKLLPHHPYKDTPDDVYEDLYLSECVVLCSTCHFMLERRHKIRCPECGGWMPLDPAVTICRKCDLKAHPEKAAAITAEKERREMEQKEIKEKKNAKARAAKRQHPCRLHTVSGKCQKSAIGSQCLYSATKAPKQCMDIVLKKREAELAQSIAGSVTER